MPARNRLLATAFAAEGPDGEDGMRITFAENGGIAPMPGLAAPVTFDTETLPADEARTLEQLVTDAAFFTLPAMQDTTPRGAADYKTFSITVHDDARQHAVRVTDLDTRPEVSALVRALRRTAAAIRLTNPNRLDDWRRGLTQA